MSSIGSLRGWSSRVAVGAVVLGMSISACSDSDPRARTTAGATNVTVTGTVVERLEAAPYTYLRLGTDAGDVWVAVPMSDVAMGSRVTVTKGATLKNFSAPRLDKKFDAVVFGTVERGG